MVIGGAGFIGSHLVDRLLAEGHVVDVVDDLSSGSLANLADARAAGGELKFHHLDVRSDDLASVIARREAEVVFHLAWLVPGRHRTADLGGSLHGLLNVLEAAAAHGVTKVVTTVPAVAWYGDVPAREQPVKEARHPEPTGPEGIVAGAGVALLAHVRRERDLEFTALAMTNVYGPRQRPDGGVVAAFVHAAAERAPAVLHGDGRQTRDLLYVDDAVDALVRAASRGSGLVINVGTGVGTPVRELWEAVAGAGAPTHRGDPGRVGVQRFALAPTRARIHLAWAPWTELATGLRATGARV